MAAPTDRNISALEMGAPPGAKTVLFLQGPPSVFWRELADAFERAGARTLRINLSAGDWLYWRKRGPVNYRGAFADWPAFLERFMRENAVTDVLYYADRLPYHAVASEIADRMGIRAISVEFGYLRPDWLTVERGGAGARCHFPEDPAAIRAIARSVATSDVQLRYPHSFFHEARNEVFYNLVSYFFRPFFPRYRADKYYDPLRDYLSWVPRLVRGTVSKSDDDALVDGWRAAGVRYYVLALQLQADYQVRANSHYRHISEFMEEVVASFARAAPADARLLVKVHPLDNGVERWPDVLGRIAAAHGVGDRAVAIAGGTLARILRHSAGVVVINSTVGLHAIRAGRPTKVLGIAMFDVAGLTDQGDLDRFWTRPDPVDPELADDFVRAIAATIQVKGSFYNPAGRAAAAAEIVRRVLGEQVNEPAAFLPVPPRLARAAARGVPAAADTLPLPHGGTPH